MNLKEKLAALQKALLDIKEKAAAEGRDFTDAELEEIETKSAEAVDLKGKIERAEKTARLLDGVGAIKSDVDPDDEPNGARSLGEHFAKHVGPKLKDREQRFTFSAPEFKAASDVHTEGNVVSGIYGPYLTDLDRTVVTGVRRRPVIADLLGKGTLNGAAIRYLVEGAREGDFTTVGEGGAKPQIHYANPTAVTEYLRKIAAFIKLSDEMIEDLDFVVSEINNRLLYDLSIFEEAQILSGDGIGTNLEGILERAIGSEAADDVDDNADAIFRAITKVSLDSGLDADGLVINPADYQSLRLSKDLNGQYFGGGFFAGQYGQGGIEWQPPVWGLRTVVTPAIPAGSALVGAYQQAATLYRKGGVSVESTNSHVDDFTNNLVTVRAEERLALAVRRPAGFVEVTLAGAGS